MSLHGLFQAPEDDTASRRTKQASEQLPSSYTGVFLFTSYGRWLSLFDLTGHFPLEKQ